MSADKLWLKKPLGFSLLELMVVVAILGVLATVAVPRFNIFRARSRQAEAKANMGVIYTLQESFQIEHESFYDGVGGAGGWGGPDMTNSNRAGLPATGGTPGGGAGSCAANKLGFRLANCDKARYGYYISTANETTWLGIAHAPSANGAPEYRIFPGCDGIGAAKTTGSGGGNIHCAHSGQESKDKGDAWCMDEKRNLENYRDIAEFCEG